MSSPEPSPSHPASSGRSLYGIYVVSLTAALLGNLLIRVGAEAGVLPGWARIGLGVLSALPLGVAAILFWRLLGRELDEMLQRIVLEGLAFALTVFVPLTALYVNLRTAGVHLPRLDPPDLLMAPAVLVALGIALAQRRFQ